MTLSRRDLLSASALLLAGPAAALRAAGREAAVSGETPIVLCWNENPYGPSPAARLAVSRAVGQACRYPDDAEIQDLVQALARHEGIGADHIVTGTGSGELLRALGLLCGRDGGEIIAAAPTYAELPDYATLRGAALKFVPVDTRLRHDLPAMQAAASAAVRSGRAMAYPQRSPAMPWILENVRSTTTRWVVATRSATEATSAPTVKSM